MPYRQPGLWLKATTTFDVLSEAVPGWASVPRGISRRLAHSAFPFPELPDRFRLLEDTLKMARQAWAGEQDPGPFQGRVVSAARVMLSPQQLSKPRIPILVGGGGERTTLRLVARYADACNVFGAPDMLLHNSRCCAGTAMTLAATTTRSRRRTWRPSRSRQTANRARSPRPSSIDRLGNWAQAGSHQTIFSIRGVSDISKIELIGRDVIPNIRELGAKSPLD